MIRIGVDLGGSKIELIALSDTGTVLTRTRQPTPSGDYCGTLKTINSMVVRAEKSLGVRGTVGVGTPGAVSNGLIKNANSTCLNAKPFRVDLETELRRPVRIANDADCFALSEAIDGSAANAKTVFGIILGTGVGAGIVVNKKLLSGPNGIAGEWGHNPLPWPTDHERPGPDCYCGKQGCIETFLSGPGISWLHKNQSGDQLTAKQIIDAASQGQDACSKTLGDFENRLARSLAHVINILDPEMIVVGGGLSNYPRIYENVPKIWGDYVFSNDVLTKLVPPNHGDSSGVRGAAWLWNDTGGS